MIIAPFPNRQDAFNALDKQINDLVKKRVEKMSNETIEELEKVAGRLKTIRRTFRGVLLDCPDMDQLLKAQINELERINAWIKKEVA